ncbi:MAG: FkbM family methyltransferase [Gemmatimonadetes bacterium]|nr:FkbM family methyltransferase [Gemmatimonadota bacterium]
MSAAGSGGAGLHDAPKHADLIYDIGAHRGEDAEFYLRKGFRVVAIEADPDLALACRRRLREFLDAGRLTIIEGAIVEPHALAAGQRTVRFYKNDANPVWGTVRAEWAERNERLGALSQPIDVPVLDLHDVLRTHGVPHYMKIDIEGVDLVCVRALGRFRERPDFVSLESDKTSFTGVAREVGALAALGYDAFQAVEQSAVPMQVPPSPAREGTHVAHRFSEGESGLFGEELPDAWRSRRAVLWQYRAIRLGYYLLGDDGVMTGWRFRGHGRLRTWTARLLRHFTEGAVPGWHDLHARRVSPGRS